MRTVRDTPADQALKLAAKYEAALKIQKPGDRNLRIDQIEWAARAAGIWDLFQAARFGGCK